MNNLSYPIGKFDPPEQIDDRLIQKWIGQIETLPERLRAAVKGLSQTQLDTPYRPGGWTIRQVVHHVPDSHISSYMRFHWALTEENPTIKAYDEKKWAELGYHQSLEIETSLDLLASIHIRWVVLLRHLNEQQLERTFVHPEDGRTYILKEVIGSYAWHGNHHLAHIEGLKDRENW